VSSTSSTSRATTPRPAATLSWPIHRVGSGPLSLLGSFPAHGTGVGNPEGILGPDDSDQNVITNPDRTLLLTVNGGSDTVAVFHIHADGDSVTWAAPRSPPEVCSRSASA
jgi:hypothetical protein